MTAKNSENKITASVKLQVAGRFGQRTWRSSRHAPVKYPTFSSGRFVRRRRGIRKRRGSNRLARGLAAVAATDVTANFLDVARGFVALVVLALRADLDVFLSATYVSFYFH